MPLAGNKFQPAASRATVSRKFHGIHSAGFACSSRAWRCKPPCQIASGFRMVMELELVKGGCLPQQLANGSRRQFQFEKRHRLAERQIEEELDEADQVAAAAAAVAVEQVLPVLT